MGVTRAHPNLSLPESKSVRPVEVATVAVVVVSVVVVTVAVVVMAWQSWAVAGVAVLVSGPLPHAVCAAWGQWMGGQHGGGGLAEGGPSHMC